MTVTSTNNRAIDGKATKTNAQQRDNFTIEFLVIVNLGNEAQPVFEQINEGILAFHDLLLAEFIMNTLQFGTIPYFYAKFSQVSVRTEKIGTYSRKKWGVCECKGQAAITISGRDGSWELGGVCLNLRR
jgi:hypothetical protein